MKAGQFLKSQFEKAGIDLNSDELKPFAAGLDAMEIEVPEKVEKAYSGSMISIKDAKNNFPDIMNHYKAQTLDGVEGTLKRAMDEYELPQNMRDEIAAEQSSFKRISLLAKNIKSLEAQKSAAKGGDKKEIQEQLDRLNEQVRAEKEARSNDQKTFKQQMKDFRKNLFIDSLSSGYKTKFDDLDPDVKNETLRAAFQKHLQDNNGKIDLEGDNDNGSFRLFRSDGTNYYSGANTPVSAKQLYEKMLADKKLLIQSGGGGQQSSNATDNNSQGNNRQNGGGASDNQNRNFGTDKVKSLNAGAMKDFQQGMKNAQPVPGRQ